MPGSKLICEPVVTAKLPIRRSVNELKVPTKSSWPAPASASDSRSIWNGTAEAFPPCSSASANAAAGNIRAHSFMGLMVFLFLDGDKLDSSAAAVAVPAALIRDIASGDRRAGAEVDLPAIGC